MAPDRGQTDPDNILRPRDWTVAELRAAGFEYLQPRRDWIVMARQLPPDEAPLSIRTAWDRLVADAGVMICFDAGDAVRGGLYEYPHWPVQPPHFAESYTAVTDPAWRPSPSQAHLLSLGCRPYRRSAGVWARRAEAPCRMQTLESPEPITVPAGAWICIGVRGAPYAVDEATLRERYLMPPDLAQ